MPLSLMLKKFIARLVFPIPLMTLLGIVALILAFRKKGSSRQKCIGKWMLIVWMVVFYLMGIFGQIPANRLDRKYPPLKVERLDASKSYTICVFGASYYPSSWFPPECHFNDIFQMRLIEGMRLARACEKRGIDYRLVVSVQTYTNATMETRREHLLTFTDMFGIPQEKILLLRDKSHTTRLEMIAFKEYPGCKILVSNGWHLPRINMFARKYDVGKTLSAPCALTSGETPFAKILPSAGSFAKFQIFAYETLGMLECILF